MKDMRAFLFGGIICATSLGGEGPAILPPDSSPSVLGEKKLDPFRPDGYLTVYFDNDLFSGTDEGYTNGVRFSWISDTREPEEFGRIQNFLRGMIGDRESVGLFRDALRLRDPDKIKYHFGLSLTQLIFTPESRTALTPPPGERPYAAWLGLGYSLHAKDREMLNSAEVSIGVIGPAALGEEAQDMTHDLRGIEKFQGWDSQIPNELTLSFSFAQKRRLAIVENHSGRFGIDGLTDWGFTLGNFKTNAFAGVMMRAGYNLPSAFSDYRISLNAYSLEPFDREPVRDGSWSVYGLAGARVTYSAFDATLDGPMFRNFETGVHREPLIGEVYAGFGVRRGNWDVSYVHTLRTREFKEQRDELHSFGSLAVRHQF